MSIVLATPMWTRPIWNWCSTRQSGRNGAGPASDRLCRWGCSRSGRKTLGAGPRQAPVRRRGYWGAGLADKVAGGRGLHILCRWCSREVKVFFCASEAYVILTSAQRCVILNLYLIGDVPKSSRRFIVNKRVACGDDDDYRTSTGGGVPGHFHSCPLASLQRRGVRARAHSEREWWR